MMACIVETASEQIDRDGSNALRNRLRMFRCSPSTPCGIGRKTEEEHKANTMASGPWCQLQEEGAQGNQGDPRVR